MWIEVERVVPCGWIATPGMKWSTLLPTGSMGILATGVHVIPSDEELITMSLAPQPDSNRQSYQVATMGPGCLADVEGRSGVRRPPWTLCAVWLATTTGDNHELPPSVNRNALTCPEANAW